MLGLRSLAFSAFANVQANRSSIWSPTAGQSTQEKAVENGLTATRAADAEAAKRRATGLDQKARAEAKLLAAAKGSRL